MEEPVNKWNKLIIVTKDDVHKFFSSKGMWVSLIDVKIENKVTVNIVCPSEKINEIPEALKFLRMSSPIIIEWTVIIKISPLIFNQDWQI